MVAIVGRAARRIVVLVVLLAGAVTSCGPAAPPVEPAPRASYDPTSGCQRALAHVVALAIKATGEGPTNGQRTDFLGRCVATGADRGSACVLKLRALPGRRGASPEIGSALACLR